MKKKYVFVLYGSTGDLAIKKILPALTVIASNDKYSQNLGILALGRKNFDTIKYLEYAKSINQNIDIKKLSDVLGYVNIDVSWIHDYYLLKNILKDLYMPGTKFVHFLALSPSLVLIVAKNLLESGIITKQSTNHRIIVEKPFGFNFKSARKLKKQLWKYFDEQQIYRMDHYLGKDTVSQIYNIKFENKLTKKLFSQEKVKSIKIFALEKDGILNRGEYYDKAGAVRDMIQSHLLQISALTLMDEPKCNACDDLINSKVLALKKIRMSKDCCFFGQYSGYRMEKNISRKTTTETFAHVTLESKKHKKVPIYIMTGKKTDFKKSGIMIEFEKGGILHFDFENSKIILKQNNQSKIVYESQNHSPYTKLLMEAFEGDKRFFVRFDEIEIAWKITDKIQKKKKSIFEYKNNNDIKKQLNNTSKEIFDEIL